MDNYSNSNNSGENLINLVKRFTTFWPYFLISILLSFLIAFLFLRYTPPEFKTTSVIEILDKAQDSEMALPTAMTIFNRSMINLDNEVGRLSSFDLNSTVTKKLKSNIKFYDVGRIRNNQIHISKFYNFFDFDLKINVDTISVSSHYNINYSKNNLMIEYFLDNEFVSKFEFNSSTTEYSNDLPFDLSLNDDIIDDLEINNKIEFNSFRSTVESFISNLDIEQAIRINSKNYSNGSDQLVLSISGENKKISEEYLSNLIFEFDLDGVNERRMEYARTIEFVDSRSKILEDDLLLIENNKQNFKVDNNLADIKSDANLSINQQYIYDNNLFDYESQRDLIVLLLDDIQEKSYKLLPLNIGLKDFAVNELIEKYNEIVLNRENLLINGAGNNNSLVRNIEAQLDNLYENIFISIKNYQTSVNLKIKNFTEKEKEFENFYNEIPENEKTLRAIDRRLNIKESLYLLLLQKREEASINYAVVKPTIKVIDSPISGLRPEYPKKVLILIGSLIFGLLIPITVISIYFAFDTKVHTRDQFQNLIETDSLPIIGEIPYLKKEMIDQSSDFGIRNPLFESIRIMLANLNFTRANDKKVILVTSSVKGEGKTLISIFTAKSLVLNKKKVILVGADLRNPQIHTNFNLDRNKLKGLSNYLSSESSEKDVNEYINNIEGLDVLFSGPIPPSPSLLLSSVKFKNLIAHLKSVYDHVIIDSAPCLLVSDTFEISRNADLTIYSYRANYTDRVIVNFIKESAKNNKLKNINLVLNGVGNSRSYGYGYGYGYKYGYRYSYNYGYGYGYSNE